MVRDVRRDLAVRRPILGLLILAACSDEPTSSDAGPTDASPARPDASTSADAGARPDADAPVDPDWSWCPTSDRAITDPSWPSSVAAAGTTLCTYANVGEVRDALLQARQLRFAAGDYRLPEAAGEYPLLVPACAKDRAGRRSALAGTGTLTVTVESLLGDTLRTYRYLQPLDLDGQPFAVRVTVEQWDRRGSGVPLPPMRWNEVTRQGTYPDHQVGYDLCAGRDCNGAQQSVWPCAAPGAGREATIVFDRGELTVTTEVFEAFGPVVPAALARARGTLDGVTFDETTFFQLAHRPDHHNWGGGFIVLFDAPIGGACGIEAQVPSRDGSFWVDRPAGWRIGCDLTRLDELANVRPGP